MLELTLLSDKETEPMADGNKVVEFTDANFDEMINDSDKLIIVDFWATWCGPCVALGPVVEELAEKCADQNVTVGKLNVDENQIITAKYAIRSIPAILFFKGQEVVDTVVGAVPLQALEDKIEEHQ
ncbi:MAG: thioredoxin [Longimicrobiales bacterium]|nr:thioredoxin [Longimicrobiales bacterium]|tara:strand:+ start:2496 stop:2873 length:378 start_codon:yes stop_codon:yes gene_type:complete